MAGRLLRQKRSRNEAAVPGAAGERQRCNSLAAVGESQQAGRGGDASELVVLCYQQALRRLASASWPSLFVRTGLGPVSEVRKRHHIPSDHSVPPLPSRRFVLKRFLCRRLTANIGARSWTCSVSVPIRADECDCELMVAR